MLANVRAPAPRTCGSCHIYGHTRANCPNHMLLALKDISVDAKVEMYKRALRVCPAHRRNTFIEHTPFDMRGIMLEVPVGERNVHEADIDFNNFRIPQQHMLAVEKYRYQYLKCIGVNVTRPGLNIVCKPDIVSGNCMVCLEDKSPEEWVEFGCNHGYCIPCRKAMNNTPLSKKCPYCTQTINELRVTDINNL